MRIIPHRGWAYRVILSGGVDGEIVSSVCLIFSLNAGVELIEPGDVPEDAQKDGGENIDLTRSTRNPGIYI